MLYGHRCPLYNTSRSRPVGVAHLLLLFTGGLKCLILEATSFMLQSLPWKNLHLALGMVVGVPRSSLVLLS